MRKYKIGDFVIYTHPTRGTVYVGKVIGITSIENDSRPYHIYAKLPEEHPSKSTAGWVAEEWLRPQGVERGRITRA